MFFRNFSEIAESTIPSLKRCKSFLLRNHIEGLVEFDHICLSCGSSDAYDAIRAILELDPPSTYSFQTILAGRRVAYFGLRSRLYITEADSVNSIELADAKVGERTTTSFHHAELYPIGISVSDLLVCLADHGETITPKVRPHHSTYDIADTDGFIFRVTQEPYLRSFLARMLARTSENQSEKM
jgi:hypothetical protein